MCDWSQLRPQYKLLRYWWVGVEIYSFSGHPRQASHVRFLLIKSAPYQSAVACLFLRSLPALGMEASFRLNWGNSRGGCKLTDLKPTHCDFPSPCVCTSSSSISQQHNHHTGFLDSIFLVEGAKHYRSPSSMTEEQKQYYRAWDFQRWVAPLKNIFRVVILSTCPFLTLQYNWVCY